MSLCIKTYRKSPDIKLPQYESEGAAGMDVRAFLAEALEIKPLERVKVPTGLIMEIPPDYEAQIRPRSGLAFREGLTIPNAPGTIDSDYRGEICVILMNLSNKPIMINNGDRIAQLVFAPVIRAELALAESIETISETKRGSKGFGSTGLSDNS